MQARLTRQLKEARSEWRAAKEEGKALQAQLDASHKQVLHVPHGSPCRAVTMPTAIEPCMQSTKCSTFTGSMNAA